MSQTLAIFTNPGSLLFMLLLLALPLSWWRRTRRIGVVLGGMMLAAVLALGLLPVDDWLQRPLEEYFAAPVLPDRVDGIVVLGGGEEPAIMAVRDWPELNSNADRLVAFIALARRYPEARLVFSGGGAVGYYDRQITEADVARRIFAILGLDPARPQYETESRNTIENARLSATLTQPKSGETWILITSARHMPRAINCFNAVGWPMLPYPVDYSTGYPPPFDFAPLRRLATLNFLIREWFGLVGYWALGHTRDILPPRRALDPKP